MCSSLMSIHGSKHPASIYYEDSHTMEDVLDARRITRYITILESARLADGGAVVLVASSSFLEKKYSTI